MKCRYKKTGTECGGGTLNVHAINEVLTGDDSAYFHELDVFLVKTGQWKDLREAFKDRDVIIDNHNTIFFEPSNDADRERGFTLS